MCCCPTRNFPLVAIDSGHGQSETFRLRHGPLIPGSTLPGGILHGRSDDQDVCAACGVPGPSVLATYHVGTEELGLVGVRVLGSMCQLDAYGLGIYRIYPWRDF